MGGRSISKKLKKTISNRKKKAISKIANDRMERDKKKKSKKYSV